VSCHYTFENGCRLSESVSFEENYEYETLARVSTMPKCHEKSTEYPLHCSAPKRIALRPY